VSLSEDFRALHHRGRPFILPNPYDAGTARLMEALGFEAVATTSSGHAASMGRFDSNVTKSEILSHACEMVASTSLPVSADLENCFADDPEGVAQTITQAVATGLAGGSVEDYSIDDANPIYELNHAVERVAAAVEAAKPTGFVVTARAENFLRGIHDLDDTIARLVAFAEVGADCVYAPGVQDLTSIAAIVGAVQIPVNVLALPGTAPVPELAEVGVARVSVGGGFFRVAYGAIAKAAEELLNQGTTSWWAGAASGDLIERAFGDRE
jgi:2-methylisocitrate lyase-like PEP mutase family enzyme